MKTIFTLLLSLSITIGIAQDKAYVHTATATNTSAWITTLDHPDLNNNPGANIIITHNLEGSAGVQYNNIVSGTWYDGANWTIFNEDLTNMIEGAAFNVYIADGGKIITHEWGEPFSSNSRISDPAINGNPNAAIITTNYWNPNEVYNTRNYGFWYSLDNGGEWVLYTEDLSFPDIQTAFWLLVDDGTGGATSFKQTATVGNTGTYFNGTVISHPSLNGIPDAYPVVTHNWGTTGDLSNIVVDNTLGVWYDGTNWVIYTENVTAIPINAEFNVFVAQAVLGVEENTIKAISASPNPTQDFVSIRAKTPISKVTLFNVLGKELATLEGDSIEIQIDLSNYASGYYLARVESGQAVTTLKLVRL